jgi:hypothetical protein
MRGTSEMQLAAFGMQNRTFDPCLTAIQRIRVLVLGSYRGFPAPQPNVRVAIDSGAEPLISCLMCCLKS